MNCEEATKLIDPYLDGELDPITSQNIELHLRDCEKCAQAYKTQSALIRAIGNAAPYHKATVELRERIQSSLRENAVDRPTRTLTRGAQFLPRKQLEPRSVLWGTPWNWLGLAAAILAAAIIAFNFVPGLHRSNVDQLLATQLIASHVRSLMADHLTDVASSDQHTVKPWLDARLDFAPPVVDLSQKGFPLIGGRLDYLDNRSVAALVYQRRKHFVNLFIWPATSDDARMPSVVTRQGYQLLHWVDREFNYWAVSDVNANDVQTFKQLFEEQTSHH